MGSFNFMLSFILVHSDIFGAFLWNELQTGPFAKGLKVFLEVWAFVYVPFSSSFLNSGLTCFCGLNQLWSCDLRLNFDLSALSWNSTRYFRPHHFLKEFQDISTVSRPRESIERFRIASCISSIDSPSNSGTPLEAPSLSWIKILIH